MAESNVQQAIVDALKGEGVTADTKTPTLKGTYKELTGETLDDAGVEAYREALRADANADPTSTAPAAKNVSKKVAKDTKAAPAKKAAKATPAKADSKTKAAAKAPAKAAPKEKVEKVALTEEQRMAIANRIVKERKADEDYPGWVNVLRVTEAGPDGKPIRVVVKCTQPQTNREGKSVCSKEKEIAAQDVFQTSRCTTCQKRHQQVYRNDLAKRRRAANPKPAVAKKAAPAKAAKKAAPAKKAAKKATAKA